MVATCLLSCLSTRSSGPITPVLPSLDLPVSPVATPDLPVHFPLCLPRAPLIKERKTKWYILCCHTLLVFRKCCGHGPKCVPSPFSPPFIFRVWAQASLLCCGGKPMVHYPRLEPGFSYMAPLLDTTLLLESKAVLLSAGFKFSEKFDHSQRSPE